LDASTAIVHSSTMQSWNNFMKEREQAPLDQLTALLHSKWEHTKEWLHNVCYDEVDAAPVQKTTDHDSYEGLDRSSSDPPSARPAEQRSNRPSISSTAPLPHLRHCSGKEVSNPLLETAFLHRGRADMEKRGQQPSTGHAAGPSRQAGTACSDSLENASDLSGARIVKDFGSMLQEGEHVEVWSNSKKAWFEGEVLEQSATEIEADGVKVPSGSYRVRYSGNTMKWIHPDHVQYLLRPSSQTPGL